MKVLLPAPAKLNLGLEVLGRRQDGFHELRSLMVTLDLRDLVTLEEGDGSVLMTGPFAALQDVPEQRNLVSRALELLGAPAWRARVYKRIPAGAGLGGGSADAAAVLRAAATLGAAIDAATVRRVAFKLGADVPFQLAGGAALVGGAGEEVEPLPLPQLWAAVAWPRLHVSTAAVFGAMEASDFSDGGQVGAAANALRRGDAVELGELPNGLWPAARRRYPVLEEAAEALRRGGWRPRLTGSGGAMFQLCDGPDEARRLAATAPLAMAAWVVQAAAPPVGEPSP